MMDPLEYEARGSSYMFLRKQGSMTSGLSSSMQPSLELCMFWSGRLRFMLTRASATHVDESVLEEMERT